MKTIKIILLSPVRFVNFLIRVQESRPYSFYALFLFSVFTGLFRGLEELLFFGIQLRNSEMFTFIHFYLSLGFILTMVLSAAGRLDWHKVNNTVVVGIFLGIFPPLIDKLFNPNPNIFYGFYFLWNFQELPWLGYKPEFNYPMGECITIWLSIFFSAYYIAYKTHSLWRTFVGAVATYGGFILYGSLLPMLVARIVIGPVASVAEARHFDETLLRSVIYYNAFAQMVLSTLIYFIMRPKVLKMLLVRSLHSVPFILVSFIGAASAGALNGTAVIVAGMLFWGGWVTLLQNQYYDLRDDRSNNPAGIEVHDVTFINVAYLLGAAALFLTGARFIIPLLISFALTFLYNYPFYRGKKKFPTNLKIEGMWGFCAFVAGLLAYPAVRINNAMLVMAFLVFGGWSLVAALKDAKDVHKDKSAGVRTLYLFLMAKGLSLTTTHRIIFSACFACFMIPPAVLVLQSAWVGAGLLGLTAFIGTVIFARFAPSRGWFAGVLLFVSVYLTELLWLIASATIRLI